MALAKQHHGKYGDVEDLERVLRFLRSKDVEYMYKHASEASREAIVKGNVVDMRSYNDVAMKARKSLEHFNIHGL